MRKMYLWLIITVIAAAITVLFVEVRKKTKKEEYKSDWRRYVTVKATGKLRKAADSMIMVNITVATKLPYKVQQVRVLITYSYFKSVVVDLYNIPAN